MDKLYKDMLDQPFKVDDVVYIHSGSFKRRIGVINAFINKNLISVVIRGIKTMIRPENIRHYTRGESIYPDQFTPFKK